MHERLTTAIGAVTPLTWQCMNPVAFRWARPPTDDRGILRPMDGLRISALSPQEDEFAMLGLGLRSAYRAFLMPHRIREQQDTLEADSWSLSAAWHSAWLAFLAHVYASAGRPGAPLLLKSPNHTFRLPAILELFPGARVIWMVRPAREVLDSNLKMWNSMFATHGLTSARDEAGLPAFLQAMFQEAARVMEWCASTLPRGRFMMVAQRDLGACPEPTINQVLRRLHLQEMDGGAGEVTGRAPPTPSLLTQEQFGEAADPVCRAYDTLQFRLLQAWG